MRVLLFLLSDDLLVVLGEDYLGHLRLVVGIIVVAGHVSGTRLLFDRDSSVGLSLDPTDNRLGLQP